MPRKKKYITEDGIEYKKHHMSKKDKKNAVLYLLPSLLGVLLFFVLPFFVVIHYALVDKIALVTSPIAESSF